MSWRSAGGTSPSVSKEEGNSWDLGQTMEFNSNPTTMISISDTLMANSTGTKESYTGGGLGISVSNFVWIYVCPIILLVGVVGNCLTIAVMRRKRLRGGTVAIYLVLIAIADTCFLVVGIIPEWLEAMDIVVFKQIHPATCKLEKFIGYGAGDTAIWLLVIFTLDRFVAVCFPLKKSDLCTTKRAKILGGFALFLAVAKNFHVFFTRGAEYKQSEEGEMVLKSNCGRPTPGADYFESFIRPWIAFTMVSAIPLILICTFNIAIVRTLLCMPTSTSTATSPARAAGGTAGSGAKVERKYSQTTLMCISVSILFLVTITPSIVLVIGRPYWDRKDKEEGPNYMYLTAKGINNALVFMNHSLNFFLYCLTGRRFREQLIAMFAGICCCQDSEFHSSAAQKASLYLKSIHKFSQEFISTTQRTEETIAGTSMSNVSTGPGTFGIVNKLPHKSGHSNHIHDINREKSKNSVKSLDSDSSCSNVQVDVGVDITDCTDLVKRRDSKSPTKTKNGNPKGHRASTVVTASGGTKTRCSVYIDDENDDTLKISDACHITNKVSNEEKIDGDKTDKNSKNIEFESSKDNSNKHFVKTGDKNITDNEKGKINNDDRKLVSKKDTSIVADENGLNQKHVKIIFDDNKEGKYVLNPSSDISSQV